MRLLNILNLKDMSFFTGSGNHQELQYYKESFSKTRLKYYTIKKIFKKNSYDQFFNDK